jgi:hypothetical protein
VKYEPGNAIAYASISHTSEFVSQVEDLFVAGRGHLLRRRVPSMSASPAALMSVNGALPIAQLRAICRVPNATLHERLTALTQWADSCAATTVIGSLPPECSARRAPVPSKTNSFLCSRSVILYSVREREQERTSKYVIEGIPKRANVLNSANSDVFINSTSKAR